MLVIYVYFTGNLLLQVFYRLFLGPLLFKSTGKCSQLSFSDSDLVDPNAGLAHTDKRRPHLHLRLAVHRAAQGVLTFVP